MPALGPVLTDLGYLLAGAYPSIARLLTPYFRWRYRRLANYDLDTIARTPGYAEAMRAALDRWDLAPRWCADIAAGTGAATRMLRQRHPQARVVAVDLSRAMLHGLAGTPGVHRIIATGWALPLADGSMDLAALHNAPPPFNELARVLRPGGFVVFGLSTAGLIPAGLRLWMLRRAVPKELTPLGETTAAQGITWAFRKRP